MPRTLMAFLALFLSTPSARRATCTAQMIDPELVQFLSTPSARRATCRLRQRQDWETNFYPRPPRGGRPQTARPRCPCERNFYPRPPRGGRRLCRGRGASSCGISIHALREEGDKIWGMGNVIIAISIHALREEGDAPKETKASCQFYFYPRPPRGGRLSIMGSGQGAKKFLSTPSARRATSQRLLPLCPALYFYPRPPRGGRRYTVINEMEVFLYFYPRPPRGGRHLPGVLPDKDKKFLSTPSARRATGSTEEQARSAMISIHALREEGDDCQRRWRFQLLQFLSTPSARRATTARRAPRDGYFISIHALREEGDPPHHSFCPQERISIHALREEGDFPWYSHHLLC